MAIAQPGCDQADDQQDHGQRQQPDSQLGAGVAAQRKLNSVGAEAALAEGPNAEQRAEADAGDQDGCRAQSQRYKDQPESEADCGRQQRAARVGQHQRNDEDPDNRVGEHGGSGVAFAPRAEPSGGGQAECCRQANGVPVAERFAQTAVGFVFGQRGREDLCQQRVEADREARNQQAAKQRAPLAGGEAHERGADQECCQQRKAAVRLQPSDGRVDRPND